MFEIITVDELIKRLEKHNHKEFHVHHTWRPNHEIYANKPDGIYWQEAIVNFHVNTNDWNDIAQHVTLLPDGKFVTGRDFGTNPASITGYNTGAFMMEMIGDFDIGKDKFEGAQRDSAIRLARYFDSKGKYIRFHRENSTKTCPGSSIDKTEFMNKVRGSMGGGGTVTVLKQGSKGPEVQKLQLNLTKLGYDTKGADGIFGNNTRLAVLAFQANRQLTQDGVAGTNTLNAIEVKLAGDAKKIADLELNIKALILSVSIERTRAITAESKLKLYGEYFAMQNKLREGK